MGIYYDEWMSENFDMLGEGEVSAAYRRILLTKWAARAYSELEEEREEQEAAWLTPSTTSPHSLLQGVSSYRMPRDSRRLAGR